MSVGYNNSIANENMADLIGEQIHRALGDVNTSLPGQIVSFDPATQTATVKVLAKRSLNGVATDYPDLVNVPVHFQRGGGFVQTMPIQPGDGGQIHFQSRDMSSWQSSGSPDAGADRYHSLSDAVLVPGLVDASKAVPDYDPTRHVTRSLDGQSYTAFDEAGNFETKTAGGATHVMDTLGNTTITTALGASLALTAAGAFAVTAASGAQLSMDENGGFTLKGSGGTVSLLEILRQLLDILANTNVVSGSSAAQWKHEGSNLTPVNSEFAKLRDQLAQITG